MIDKLLWLASAVLLSGAIAGAAQAQDTFNGRTNSNPTAQGNPNCPPPVINGITPLNWSCRTGPQSYTIPPVTTVARPGPYAPPGSYIVPPAGPPGSYIVPHAGPPGTYIQPETPPGGYVNSTARSGPGGSGTQVHTGPGGAIILSPGNNANAKDAPGRQGTQGIQGGGFGNGAAAGFQPGNAVPNRQDIGAMQGGVASNGGASPYRQDTGAMQGAVSGSGFGNGAQGLGGQALQALVGAIGNSAANAAAAKTASRRTTTAKNMTAKKASTAAANAAANAQAAQVMNGFIKMLGTEP